MAVETASTQVSELKTAYEGYMQASYKLLDGFKAIYSTAKSDPLVRVSLRDSVTFQKTMTEILESFSGDINLAQTRQVCVRLRSLFADNEKLIKSSSNAPTNSKPIAKPEIKATKAATAPTNTEKAKPSAPKQKAKATISETLLNMLSFSDVITRLKKMSSPDRLTNPESEANIIVILKFLRGVKVTSSLLKTTEAGKFLTSLKKQDGMNSEIRDRCRDVCEIWKQKVQPRPDKPKAPLKVSKKPTKVEIPKNSKFSRMDEQSKENSSRKSREAREKSSLKPKSHSHSRERRDIESRRLPVRREREVSEEEWMRNHRKKLRESYQRNQREEQYSMAIGAKEDLLADADHLG